MFVLTYNRSYSVITSVIHLTSSDLLLILTYFPSRSTSSTVTRPLAEACWVMRVRAMAPPVKLEASLSVSLGRRLLAGEFWLP